MCLIGLAKVVGVIKKIESLHLFCRENLIVMAIFLHKEKPKKKNQCKLKFGNIATQE